MSKMNLVEINKMIENNVVFENILNEDSMVERVDNYAWYDGDFEEWLDENGIKMVATNDNHYVFEDDSHFATVEYVEQENRFSYDCEDETIFDFSTLKVFDKFQ